jgi:hypothetical protein
MMNPPGMRVKIGMAAPGIGLLPIHETLAKVISLAFQMEEFDSAWPSTYCRERPLQIMKLNDKPPLCDDRENGMSPGRPKMT